MAVQARFRFATAWLPEGWHNDVVVAVDDAGDIASISTEDRDTDAVTVTGAAIPGMPNVHSHAFQRAMAGLAECRSSGRDSFWTWRESMYALAGRMTPELLNVIAAQLYVEMLKAGYTAVCEFHYLHNQPDGQPFADRSVMSQALLDAAASSGIGLTLLPALYQTADFGGEPPTQRQRQFVLDADAFMRLIDDLQTRCRSAQVTAGAALHSLRAVPASELRAILEILSRRDSMAIHIHVAEQEREVADSVRFSGRRPVEWLLENAHVDDRWCLVHATHAMDPELEAIARSHAVVALCPTTEANLGDGIFRSSKYLASQGRIAIGSDSHISISPVEELRWLEYQARLGQRERNVLSEGSHGSTGARLWRLACTGGAQACGRKVGVLEAGCRADIVVLDLNSPSLVGRTGDAIIDTFIFSGQPSPVRDVMVGGRWLVQDQRHFAEAAIAAGYRRAITSLMNPPWMD